MTRVVLQNRSVFRGACALAVAALFTASVVSAESGGPNLPGRRVVVDIDSPTRGQYPIAIPQPIGDSATAASMAEILTKDLQFIGLFRVLDPRSFVADLNSEGLGVKADAWRSVGANGVIKGNAVKQGDSVALELRFYDLSKPDEPRVTRTYKGPAGNFRVYVHDFANDLIKHLTGIPGGFSGQIAFARRFGVGRKAIYVADFDGYGAHMVSGDKGVSTIPAFGPGGSVWYTQLTRTGMYITSTKAGGKPVIQGDGVNIGVNYCNGRMLFSSSRSGNSEIYSASPDGGDVRRLTNDPGIDVSPVCGPNGKIAFVSSRHGGAQIFTMNTDGSGVKRVTYRGNYNQTPAWCPDPKRNLLAFTGRQEALDIFTVDLDNGEYTRITERQGQNKDPAFSPDCRLIAFASTRQGGGIYMSTADGLNHALVLKGAAETIRWTH